MTDKAERYLSKIREIYSQTHGISIDTLSVSGEPNNDGVFMELEENGYIKFHKGVSPTVDLLEKTTKSE